MSYILCISQMLRHFHAGSYFSPAVHWTGKRSPLNPRRVLGHQTFSIQGCPKPIEATSEGPMCICLSFSRCEFFLRLHACSACRSRCGFRAWLPYLTSFPGALSNVRSLDMTGHRIYDMGMQRQSHHYLPFVICSGTRLAVAGGGGGLGSLRGRCSQSILKGY